MDLWKHLSDPGGLAAPVARSQWAFLALETLAMVLLLRWCYRLLVQADLLRIEHFANGGE